jgi:ferredoxin--NADP+ reductase
MPKWCEGTITERKVWSTGLFTLQIDAPQVESFLPGQFLHLGIPCPDGHLEPNGEPHIVNRPYSVASPHGEKLEFFIVLVEGGQLTPHLWKFKQGNRVLVSQTAAGSFTLKKAPIFENLWLFATGTGLAPYIAMVRDPCVWQQYRRVFIVHGVRYALDLAYTEELRQLEQSHPGRFKLFQVLSRETQPGYLIGRITDAFETGELEREAKVDINSSNSAVMLCGNPAMLDSMEELFNLRGMHVHRSKKPGNIVHERYW